MWLERAEGLEAEAGPEPWGLEHLGRQLQSTTASVSQKPRSLSSQREPGSALLVHEQPKMEGGCSVCL